MQNYLCEKKVKIVKEQIPHQKFSPELRRRRVKIPNPRCLQPYIIQRRLNLGSASSAKIARVIAATRLYSFIVVVVVVVVVLIRPSRSMKNERVFGTRHLCVGSRSTYYFCGLIGGCSHGIPARGSPN